MTDRRCKNVDYDGGDKRSIERLTFLQGNQIKFWRSAVISLLLAIGGICVWTVTEVTEIPKVYATQEYVDKLGAKMDTHFANLQSSIDDVNRYLRE